MKNVLQYYYNLVPKTIHQINSDYRCQINDNEYIFCQVNNGDREILEIKNLSDTLCSRKFFCHRIVLNLNKDILTNVDGNLYVLLKMEVNNRIVDENDLVDFSRQYVEKNKYEMLNHSNWYELWTKKIDYIEYQVSQLGKNYPIIRASINYYIGMAETAICIIPNINMDNLYLSVSHKRVKAKSKLKDFYDPFQFVLDHRIRDLSEYYKEQFFSNKLNFEKVKELIIIYKLSSQEAILFYARMLYPSYYFDCYQQIVLGELEEKEINKYIVNAEKYQEFLKQVYYFLKINYDIPKIEWIIKD